MFSRLSSRHGVALPAAILAIVVIGALIASAFFAAMTEQRTDENTRRVAQAFGVAEEGALEQLRGWNAAALDTMSLYPTRSYTVSHTAAAFGGGAYQGTIMRTGTNYFFINVTGNDTSTLGTWSKWGGGRQHIGVLTRFRPLTIPVTSALKTRGGTGDLRGGGKSIGTDSIPSGWTGCTVGTSLPGLQVTDTTAYKQGGNQLTKNTLGNPAYVQDTTIKTSDFDSFNGVLYTDLAARANITLPGGTYAPAPAVTGTTCNTATTLNWGDGINQTAPCGSYAPIVHITGNLSITAKTTPPPQGQGILLVDGDVFFSNSFQYYGVIIVQGSLTTNPFTAVYGGMMVKNQNNAFQDIWDIHIQYSSCVLAKVLGLNGNDVAPLRSRSWVQLY